ncbi:MAG: hypothetical protein KBA75_10155 [Alphaproteobacteria bacterium]|nr:hypothetical protein [Alphaproteobacteria bacterium]
MRTPVTVFLFTALFLLLVAPALAHGCAAATAPIVKLEPLSGSANVDNSKSQRELQSLSGVGQSSHSTRIPVALGLTLTQVMTTSRLTAEIASGGWTGPKCATLQSLNVGFGFSPHMIYIPYEFAPNTCAYNAIYSHEIQHVNTDQALLKSHLPAIKSKIMAGVAALPPITGNDDAAMQKTMKDQLERLLTDIQTDFTRVRQLEQAKVDNPNEYARVGNSCGGIIKQIGNH